MISPETLLAYLPQDRRQALITGRELPPQTDGTALWADISGFTPLTETLMRKLGKRRGAEELASQLNHFYDALIAPVDTYGGSVIDFSGDAINCWFEADDGRRALTAALNMQAAMQPFASLHLPTGDVVSVGVKIAVASGPIRRFQVGDPDIQYLDTLAGSTMERLAVFGHLAATGEVLVDEATATQLQTLLQISERRQSTIIVRGLAIQIEPSPQAILPNLTGEQVRPWLLPAVFARLQGGQGEFLTELRPAVALFMHFAGLDYDSDEQAGEKLDIFIRRVQKILAEYEGTLLQLTLGDKGSYLYAAFGAPVAHENDIARAVTAALELLKLPTQVDGIHSVNIGLSRGTMRTGAYGSATRRTYGVLGDEVNLAARLMQRAAPGQILASETVWQAASGFDWQAQPTIEVKGRSATVTPALLLGRPEGQAIHTHKAITSSPMIGRQAELALIEEKLTLARQGQGQIVSITGEAGMGKSRLLAEVLQRASGLTRYGGECQSYGTQSAYLVWHAIWHAFFGLTPSTSLGQIASLEAVLAQLNPDFPLRLPLLGPALNLSIPDNGLTSAMDSKARKASRESLLVDCLRARAGEQPLVLILEDLHWIDPLSRDLLEKIARAIKELPVLILLAYRPPVEGEIALLPDLAKLEYVIDLHLGELTSAETEQLIATHLAHLGLDGDIPPILVERLSTRTQGNPFYIEELLNYLLDRNLDLRREETWEQADLPDSLHRLILSRIDRLAERQQVTLKAASVIGRLFRAAWLHGYYPALGGPERVSADLEILNRLEFTLLETPEPELTYLFKHVITQEAAYESLAYATRSGLHEQFAHYLELAAEEDTSLYLDLLAYHYERSENLPKKCEYLRKAGEAAASTYANEAALSYLGKALALVSETDDAQRFDILATRVKIYTLLGKQENHNQDVTTLSALAENLDDNERRAQAAINRSRYAHSTSNFPAAIAAAQQAVAFAHLAGANEHEAQGYFLWGEALRFQDNYVEARMRKEQALTIAQNAHLTRWIANSLMSLGTLDIRQGNYDSAQAYLEHALQLHREVGNRISENSALSHLGLSAFRRGDFAKAQAYYEQTLPSWRLIGDKHGEAFAVSRLANLIVEQRGDYAKAKLHGEQALSLFKEIGERLGQMASYYQFSLRDLAQNNYLAAKIQVEQGLRISREIGVKFIEAGCLSQFGSIADELGEYVSALEYHRQGISILHEVGDQDAICQVLTSLGLVFYHLGQHKTALENSQQALSIAQETKNKQLQNHALSLQGHTLRELGELDQAIVSYQQALDSALELNLPHLIKQAQTGLAAVALARGDVAQAQVSLDEILLYLETHHLSTQDEIFWIYLTCYRILQAIPHENDHTDQRAQLTLKTAYDLLQQIAATIDDENLQASFLQNVHSNREIVQAWESLTAS